MDARHRRVTDETLATWHDDAIAGVSAALVQAPAAPVAYYDGWTLADHAVHVVRVHVMACASLRTGGTERPSWQLQVDAGTPAEELAAELHRLAVRLRRDVDACPHATVWVPGASAPPGFWRRRMLSESVLHRWDAESALGRAWAPERDVLEEVVDEFLTSRVARPDDAAGVVVLDVGTARWVVPVAGGGRTTVSAAPAELWRWLNRRADAPVREVRGDRGPFEELEATLAGLRPARR